MSFLLEGITAVTWQQAVMYVVGIILIWLAVKKEYEPSLLLPLGFGAILVNLPYSGVVDQMVQGKVPAAGIIEWLFKTGIEASEAMPILLFIGIGAMIDFGPLLSSCFLQKLRSLNAVLLRVHLKVNVVQQAGGSPEIRLLPISLVLGKPTHHSFHGKGVEDVEWLPVIFFQGLQGPLPCQCSVHLT